MGRDRSTKCKGDNHIVRAVGSKLDTGGDWCFSKSKEFVYVFS